MEIKEFRENLHRSLMDTILLHKIGAWLQNVLYDVGTSLTLPANSSKVTQIANFVEEFLLKNSVKKVHMQYVVSIKNKDNKIAKCFELYILFQNDSGSYRGRFEFFGKKDMSNLYVEECSCEEWKNKIESFDKIVGVRPYIVDEFIR